MRQVVVSAGAIDVVSVDAPRPGPGEVLVQSVVAGMCGSDTHAAAGLHPWISLPYVPGHEVVGVVAETGADPLQATLTAAASQRSDPLSFLRIRELFGDLVDHTRFATPYLAALDSLHRRGARATVESLGR